MSYHRKTVAGCPDELIGFCWSGIDSRSDGTCVKDGQPCFVGRGTDDAHFRCGTVQCGMKAKT